MEMKKILFGILVITMMSPLAEARHHEDKETLFFSEAKDAAKNAAKSVGHGIKKGAKKIYAWGASLDWDQIFSEGMKVAIPAFKGCLGGFLPQDKDGAEKSDVAKAAAKVGGDGTSALATCATGAAVAATPAAMEVALEHLPVPEQLKKILQDVKINQEDIKKAAEFIKKARGKADEMKKDPKADKEEIANLEKQIVLVEKGQEQAQQMVLSLLTYAKTLKK
jgi:hypothetical protein